MLRCCALLAAGTAEALTSLTARRRIRATAAHARRRRIHLSAAKDDGVFEAKAKGVAPASVSALSPRRDDTPKWMLKKKALAQAATTVSDDEHR